MPASQRLGVSWDREQDGPRATELLITGLLSATLPPGPEKCSLALVWEPDCTRCLSPSAGPLGDSLSGALSPRAGGARVSRTVDAVDAEWQGLRKEPRNSGGAPACRSTDAATWGPPGPAAREVGLGRPGRRAEAFPTNQQAPNSFLPLLAHEWSCHPRIYLNLL